MDASINDSDVQEMDIELEDDFTKIDFNSLKQQSSISS